MKVASYKKIEQNFFDFEKEKTNVSPASTEFETGNINFRPAKENKADPTDADCCYWCNNIIDFNGVWKCYFINKFWQQKNRFEWVCNHFNDKINRYEYMKRKLNNENEY
jgi:hypothetical protein